MSLQNWKQNFFLLETFNKEEEDSYLEENKVTKFYKSVYLINYIYIVPLPGKVLIFCCFIMP